MMIFDTIVSDFDGTLLDANGEISPKTLSVLKECMRRGIRVIPNSRRTRSSMAYYMNQLQTGQPYIGGNGTELMDASGEYLWQNLLSPQQLRGISRTIEQLHLYAQVYDEDCFYFEKSYETSESYCVASRMKAIPVGKLSEFITKPSSKILAINPPEKNAECKALLQEQFGNELVFSSSCSDYLEIMPAGSSKGNALLRLAEMKGWDLNKILVFGDGLNDVSMIQAVSHGVAMGNAIEEAKAAAWRICLPNTEDGLARFLEETVLCETEVSE